VKFKKKPVVIEAVKFEENSEAGWPEGVYKDNDSPTGYAIETLEGRALNVAPGDWIIVGVKGERYPCKPDVFEITYEPVEDALQK
jgi:hypothetical protein